MAKIKMASADLAHIFRERLMAFEGASIGTAVAIVPDKKFGWTALFPTGNRSGRRRRLPQERVYRIQTELRRIYQLTDN